jgi:hypothetical protein
MDTDDQATNDDLIGMAGGLAFASAYAWITVFQKILDSIVPGKHDSVWFYAMSAIFVTLLAYSLFYLIRAESNKRARPKRARRAII